MINICPISILRLAGGSIALIPQDKFEVSELLNGFTKSCEDLISQADLVRNLLFSKIPEQPKEIRGKSIKIQTKLRSSRALTQSDLEFISEVCPKELAASFREALEKARTLEQEYGISIEKSIQCSNDELLLLCDMPWFKNALSLSSLSLFKLADKVRNDSGKFKGSKRAQVLNGLLRYFVRSVSKTSPFSQFCSLSAVSVGIPKCPELPPAFGPPVSYFAINNTVYRFVDYILRNDIEISDRLPIKLNCTISVSGSEVKFLENAGNVESFIVIKNDAILQVVLDIFNVCPTTTLTELKSAINEDFEFNEPADLDNYLSSLLKNNFLEMQHGVPGDSPKWYRNLRESLIDLPISNSRTVLIEYLDYLNTFIETLPSLGVQSRVSSIEQHYATLSGLIEFFLGRLESTHAEFLGEVFERFKLEDLVLEDSIRETDFVLPADLARPIVDSLQDFLDKITIFDPFFVEREMLKSFFASEFGLGTTISLLEFYEAYFIRGPGKQRLGPNLGRIERDLKPEDRQIENDILSRRSHWLESVKNSITVSGDSLHLTSRLLPQSAAKMDNRSAYTAFIQFGQNLEQSWMPVLNLCTAGLSKMYSRFVSSFGDSTRDQLITWNQRFAREGELLCENSDASLFNANMHPLLVEAQLESPGRITSNDSPKLNVSRINVGLESLESEFQITEGGGRPVTILNLSFESVYRRSPLFQFIEKISPTRFLNPVSVAYRLIDTPSSQGSDVYTRPRVVLDNQLVLLRKAWVVPRRFLPQNKDFSSNAEFFQALTFWRTLHGIPEDVYLRHRRIEEGTITSNGVKVPSELFKPQFISFGRPIFLNLIGKIFSEVVEYVTFEEVSPPPSQLINNEPYASEFILQWISQ